MFFPAHLAKEYYSQLTKSQVFIFYTHTCFYFKIHLNRQDNLTFGPSESINRAISIYQVYLAGSMAHFTVVCWRRTFVPNIWREIKS